MIVIVNSYVSAVAKGYPLERTDPALAQVIFGKMGHLSRNWHQHNLSLQVV